METWTQMLVTALVSVLACSGFWTFMQKLSDKKDVRTQMLIGLGHDRILELGLYYIERGDWITQDEYDNLVDYLYKPYAKMGGNGSAERIIKQIQTELQICKGTYRPGHPVQCEREPK